KIHIPDSVTKIDKRAFYAWELVGKQTIYCSPNSAAYSYAKTNDFLVEIE
ncbi:MAG: hypothetical protein K0R46_3120, partial [Herbinix sp.]|nr:hypothetical protein [Herbinix sp.]